MKVEDTEYQKEYDKAAAELDAAATATTARDPDGKFAKVEAEKVETPEPEPEAKPEVDPLAELRARVEKAEKIAKDQQAWATRVSQENAQIRREQEQRAREAAKPAILDANPELADAIRFVANDPAPQRQQEDHQANWQAIIDKAHPGIFSTAIDPELEKSLMTRLGALDDSSRHDPLIVIREITEEKLAHAERQVGKRFAAESAKLAQKSAMSVPGAGAGSGVKAAPDAALAEVQRIQRMTDAEFQKEVRRVKGY